MPRRPRIIVPGLPHHITQRGNRQSDVFQSDADCRVFLDLLIRHSTKSDLRIWGYCLMPNHFHIVAVPGTEVVIARVIGRVEADYARYFNVQNGYSGHLWQPRYFSIPMSPVHCWNALAYVERNPVRAGLVVSAEQFQWSSASAHLGFKPMPQWLKIEEWGKLWTPVEWRSLVENDTEMNRIGPVLREQTRTGIPLGDELISRLEVTRGVRIHMGKAGRPVKQASGKAA